VASFYDNRASTATQELDVGRGVYHDVPREIAAHLEATEEQLADVCATSLSGLALDAGCGNGNVLVRVLSRTRSVRFVGLDLSHGMLARAQQRTRQDGAVSGFAQGNVVALPFADESFESAACLEVLVHVPSRDEIVTALGEMHRVLKPGGVLVVTMLTNTLSLRGAFINCVLRPFKRGEPDLFGLHSSVWLLRQLRARGFRVDWYSGWDRPIVNRSYLYWFNAILRVVDRVHAWLSRHVPACHLLRDRIVFRCIKAR
jgi:ubiquinone/menaquinone biosynthesis C-methylase UbiE